MRPHNKNTVSGFSLIELMIAMLIGLVILNGVIQVVISSKRSYLDNQAISQIQENARFALDTLSREVRMAGYFGCMPVDSGEIESEVSTTRYSDFLVRGGDILGVEVIRSSDNYPGGLEEDDVLRGDVLIVRHTDSSREFTLLDTLANTAAIADVDGDDNAIKDGEPVALVSSGCELANVFTWGTSDKPEGEFSKTNFKAGSRISPVQVSAYYIGGSSVVENMPALKREVILADGTTRSDELAMGVRNMVLEVINVNGAVVAPADPDTSLANTKAIRINLELRSHDRVNPVKTDDSGDVTDNGYITQSAVATVRIRNKG